MTSIEKHPSNLCPQHGCAVHTLVEQHARQIDANSRALDMAHQKLRDHENALASLSANNEHGLERLARVEATATDQHRLLMTLEGDVRGLTVMTTNVSVTANSTYELLQRHITENTANLERVTKRLIQIVGLTGATVILLALIHSALSGQPLLSMIVSFLNGMGAK